MKKIHDWQFQGACNRTRESFLEFGEIPPMVFAYTPNDELHILAVPFANDEQRLKVLHGLKLYFLMNAIEHYVFAFESWTVRAEDGKRPDVQPRDHPDKKEAICVMSVSRERRRCASYMIHRDDGLRLDEARAEMASLTGDFAELLCDPDLSGELSPQRRAFGETILKALGFKAQVLPANSRDETPV